VRTWQTAATPNCENQTTYQTVSAGRVRATGCFRAEGNRYVADGAVRLNGVLLQTVGTGHSGNAYRFGATTGLQSFLDSGNRLYIDRPGNALGTTGTWKMSVEHLAGMHQGVLNVRNVQWTGTAPLMSVGADRSVELFDFPLAGQLSLTPYDDGTSRLGGLVSLPLPRMDSVTGDAAVNVNPGGDLAFDRLRVEVGALPVRGFGLGNVKFLYDRTEEQWEGAAEVTLPTASRVRVAAAVVVRHGRFGSFEGSVDGLNQHLAYGVFLQRIGVRVGVDPVHLGGSIGLSAGPKVGGVGIRTRSPRSTRSATPSTTCTPRTRASSRRSPCAAGSRPRRRPTRTSARGTTSRSAAATTPTSGASSAARCGRPATTTC
jgi:hypothetical protein